MRKQKIVRWEYIEYLVVFVDQLTKYLIIAWLPQGSRTTLMPFLNFNLAHNHGAAFGFLAAAGGWQRWFFVILALIIVGAGVVWMRRLDPKKDNYTGVGIALILGGAMGNVIDRIRLGYVIDFIDFHVGTWHWYTFNVADIAICVGAAFIILGSHVFTAKR